MVQEADVWNDRAGWNSDVDPSQKAPKTEGMKASIALTLSLSQLE